jgi:hypothetical protein
VIDENANGERQIIQRAVDESGDIIEITLNENGEIVGEDLVGNVGSLPVEEEYVDEEGRNVSRVTTGVTWLAQELFERETGKQSQEILGRERR